MPEKHAVTEAPAEVKAQLLRERAYRQGERARREGAKLEENPYTAGHGYRSTSIDQAGWGWELGWRTADAAIAAKHTHGSETQNV